MGTGPAHSESATDESHLLGTLHRHALDSLLEGCWVIGPDERYLYVNETAAAQARRPREELVGRSISECYPEIEHTAMLAALRRCLSLRTHEQLETEYTFPGGEVAWFELRFVPIPEGVFALALDVTARRSAEGDRAHLQEQLQRSRHLETIGRLAGGVAHDFNNLLTTILSCADAALDVAPQGADGDRLRGDLRDIREAGRRAAELTNRLLAFSRQQLLQPRVVDLNDVIREMLEVLRRVGGDDVFVDFLPSAGPALVNIDPAQVEQVLLNLAANAHDAMPRGGRLAIETAHADVDARLATELDDVVPGPHVVLTVSDSGVGMSRETRAHLFEPFFTTKGVAARTGLGLASVYGIVKQTGGGIAVESEPGRGAAFRLYFPVAAAPVPAPHGAARATVDPTRVTVLLVEDEAAVRRITARVLADAGYRVLTASTPHEALHVAAEPGVQIDLLLTDVILPAMSGRELAEQLQRARPSLRVLYMSGYTDDAMIQHGVLERGVAFISKPFNGREITQKIEDVLGS